MKFNLTEALIQETFEATGINPQHYDIFHNEAISVYNSLEEDIPDDEETTYDESNVKECLIAATEHTSIYSKEIEKGHCEAWALSFASDSVKGESESYVVRNALDSIGTEEERDRELNIHAESINPDPIFQKRYKEIIFDGNGNIAEQATEYAMAYHWCINNGKSQHYAHAYADVSMEYHERFCEIHAEAYEIAKLHGMDDDQAYQFGDSCTEACDRGYSLYLKGFIDYHKEDWQKDFYVYLMCKEYKDVHKSDMPAWELEEIKKEIY